MKNVIEELFSEYGTLEPFQLAEKMGINIFHHELGKVNGYYMMYNDVPNIVINKTLPRHFQTFVVAHEIGHAVLHPNVNSLLLQDTMYPIGRREREANIFAINLLLSDSMVYDNPDRTIDDWASILGLPREVIELKFRG